MTIKRRKPQNPNPIRFTLPKTNMAMKHHHGNNRRFTSSFMVGFPHWLNRLTVGGFDRIAISKVNDHPVSTSQWKRVNHIVERRFGRGKKPTKKRAKPRVSEKIVALLICSIILYSYIYIYYIDVLYIYVYVYTYNFI